MTSSPETGAFIGTNRILWLPRRNPMGKTNLRLKVLIAIVPTFWFGQVRSHSQVGKNPYPIMAPLDQYLIADEKVEIALARSAAPASISNAAEVMVLRRDGYASVDKGTNGFVCLVERSW